MKVQEILIKLLIYKILKDDIVFERVSMKNKSRSSLIEKVGNKIHLVVSITSKSGNPVYITRDVFDDAESSSYKIFNSFLKKSKKNRIIFGTNGNIL